MKNRLKRFSLIALCAMTACHEEKTPTPPSDFNVNIGSAEVSVGEAVVFSLSGDADIITFYSGEVGNDYDHISGRIVNPRYVLTFDEQAIDGNQENQLKVFLSKDFNEDYTIDGINGESVSWIDISSRFDLLGPGQVTGERNYVNVGYADISDLITEETTTAYLGFQYTAKPYSSGQTNNIIRVRNILAKSYYNFVYTDLYAWNDFGFQFTSRYPQQASRPSMIYEDSKYIQFRVGWGNHEDGGGTYQGDGADNWVVSKKLTFQQTLDMGPDWGVGIKGISDMAKTSYEYTYDHPGAYTAVFVAKNANAHGIAQKTVAVDVVVKE